MAGIAKLAVIVGAQTSGLQRDMQRADGIIRGFANRMAFSLAGALGGFTAGAALGWGVKLAAEAETAKIAFEVMLGSAEKAQGMLQELRALAASTPLEFGGLQDNAKMLIGFGLAAEQVLPALRTLGDITGGNTEKMHRLTLAYAQSAAAGRLMGQDLLQMINAGFNPLQEISKNTGLSMVELKAKMEEGAISFDLVKQAFESATGTGGRFHGMLDRMSTTLAGRWGKLKDSAALLATKIGTVLMPAMEKLVGIGTAMLTWLEGMNASTIESIAKIVAWGAAMGLLVTIVPRIVAGIRSIVIAIQAMTTAQGIAQAMSGPKGWLALAGGLAAAAGVAFAVNELFSDMNEKLEKQSKVASAAAAAVGKLGDKMAASAKSAEALTEATAASDKLKKLSDLGKQVTEENQTPWQKYEAQLTSLNELLTEGQITWATYSRAVAKAKGELDDLADSSRSVEAARRINIGAVTRNSTAGFSAVQDARAEQREQIEAVHEVVAQQKTTNEILEEMLRSLELDPADFIVNEVSF